MKQNYKIFKSLTNPVDIQEVDGKTIEIHYMNDTPYLSSYVGRGYYFVWSSDGKIHKLLVEKGYYEVMKEFFAPEVAVLQIKFTENLYKARDNYTLKPFFVFVILILTALGLTSYIDRTLQTNYNSPVLITSVIAAIFLIVIQKAVFNKKALTIREEYFKTVQEVIGPEVFDELIHKQTAYHKAFHNFEDEEPIVEEDQPLETKNEEMFVLDEIKLEPNFLEAFGLLGVEELRDFARERKILNFSTMRKLDLLEALPNKLEDLKVNELKALARAQEVPNFSTMRKPELIAALDKIFADDEEEFADDEEEFEEDDTFDVKVVDDLKEPEEPIDEQELIVEEEPPYLEAFGLLGVEELRDFARERKVPNFSTMRKLDLLEALPNKLEDLKVNELKALARAQEVLNFSTMRKPELIKALKK